MTFIPTQSGFMRLEDSETLLRAIFQAIRVWNRAILRHVWNRVPDGASSGPVLILRRREDISRLRRRSFAQKFTKQRKCKDSGGHYGRDCCFTRTSAVSQELVCPTSAISMTVDFIWKQKLILSTASKISSAAARPCRGCWNRLRSSHPPIARSASWRDRNGEGADCAGDTQT